MPYLTVLSRVAAMSITAATATATAQEPRFDAAAYLDRAIAIVRANALFAERVDWPAVTARVHAQGDAARDVFDTYPALVMLVRALGDRHSFLQLSGERAAAYRTAKGQAFRSPLDPDPVRPPDRRFFGRVGPAPTDRLIRGYRVRTVIVTATADNAPAALNGYAAALHRAVIGSTAACGYVVDLRGNTGGNTAPMIAGLGVLAGNGAVGGFRAREGVEQWVVRGARFLFRTPDGREQVAVRIAGWRALAGGTRLPVALLIDGGTASSGEIAAIALLGRADVRSFGQPTVGISTSTSGYRLSDGANLVLVDAQVQDSIGRVYPAGVTPDVVADGDHAVTAANDWVAARCAAKVGRP